MPLHQIEDGFAVLVHREPLPLPLQARITKPTNKHDKNPQRLVSDLETANGERVARGQKCEGLGFEYAPGGGRAGGGGKKNDASLLIVDEQGARLLRPRLPESRHGRSLWYGCRRWLWWHWCSWRTRETEAEERATSNRLGFGVTGLFR
jgi:hypothetical protein